MRFRVVLLDGAYEPGGEPARFRRVTAPAPVKPDALLAQIVTRIAPHLERRGLLVRDADGRLPQRGPGDDAGLEALLGHSITYRIAVGPNEAHKAFTLQALAQEAPPGEQLLSTYAGLSLHAGAAAAVHRRDKCERLCRYLARPGMMEPDRR